MTIEPTARITERKLAVLKDQTILTNLPENVIANSGTDSGPVEGVFLGAVFDQESSRQVVSLGTLRDLRFMACFRFRLWWMAQRMGDRGGDIPLETLLLLAETKDIDESGDSDTVGPTFTHSVYVSSGTDPFGVITEAFRVVKLHPKTFRQRHEKQLPGIVDYFGWCTWDAFYRDVTQEGVEDGLRSLSAGGTPPKFVIIDDGWQSVWVDDEIQGETDPKQQQLQQPPLNRLTGIKENPKFRNKDDPTLGIKNIVKIAKEKYGVELTKQYHQALDASIAKSFPDNGCVACMSQNTDGLYCSKQTAIVRASDDFFLRIPESHTIHIAAVAYKSIFVGEFMQPDWDMFHSVHPAAEFHASARAISGGPLYVSDAPGKHNFDLLKKLVLPDGSILRARLPGRPTVDCLLSDPCRDGVSIEKKNTFHQTNSEAITGYIRGCDVHLIREVALDPEWSGDCVVYCHSSGKLVCLPHNAAMQISLKVLEQEIFTVTPIKNLAPGFSFAPLGLMHMYNAGGAIEGLEYYVKAGTQLSERKGPFWMGRELL
ncbi:OLC1v1015497C1 [Oldenlandia corymbosa var. corymbosa]|uniref:galactinol--sucrose galactosyltransferase n=1 Tax=Oldenlandia corymbosa var. corymbosa TaxID=529605 RepID=A0AAV1E6J6_OLDCO|nr:OLC1v1015497C1 [Oldenlandia corymbosa var. corymbosa]